MNQPGVENRGIEQEVFDVIQTHYNKLPCYKTMGIKLTYLDKKAAGMKMTPDVSLSALDGRVHGGIIATLADAVMGAAGGTMGHVYRTAEMKLNYIAPAFDSEELVAEARVIHPGKTLSVIEADIFTKDGKLIAKSLATFFRDKTRAAYTEGDDQSL